ncbi:MAG TPA: DUF2127 domain-containing protein [Acidimicrobiales bacterium]|nr:DUF2127 domain-containing protein [Acidimicrobiales bacterium]
MARRRKLSYELFECAWNGHYLVGTDAAEVRPQDGHIARIMDGLRWHRCLRCDTWVPLERPPAGPEHPPERQDIEPPLRGRPLRDKYVLRLIAVDRAFHFVVLSVLAAAVFVFAADRSLLHRDFLRIVTAVQGGAGGPVRTGGTITKELTHLFSISTRNLELTGVALAAYAVLEGVEAVGLWKAKRWAEYLTFIATALLVPLEVYEIAKKPTALKAVTLAINVAIVVYLVLAKRLFGVRGGWAAEQARRERESGWAAIERATPVFAPASNP